MSSLKWHFKPHMLLILPDWVEKLNMQEALRRVDYM